MTTSTKPSVLAEGRTGKRELGGAPKAVLKDESFALLLILELSRRGRPYALIHT